jgi:hypothetical protein
MNTRKHKSSPGLNLKTRVINGVVYYEDNGIRWPKADFDDAIEKASKKLRARVDKLVEEQILKGVITK